MAGVCNLDTIAMDDPVYLDADPLGYDDNPAPRRMSSHPTQDGGRVVQDFGVHLQDRVLKVHTEWMESATLAEFQSRYEQQGVTWIWTDYKSAVYEVVFQALRAEKHQGYDAYRVDLEFAVVDIPT